MNTTEKKISEWEKELAAAELRRERKLNATLWDLADRMNELKKELNESGDYVRAEYVDRALTQILICTGAKE